MPRTRPSRGSKSSAAARVRTVFNNAALAAKDNESTANGTVPLIANSKLPNGGPANWATVVSDV